jgi:hypothetical protein
MLVASEEFFFSEARPSCGAGTAARSHPALNVVPITATRRSARGLRSFGTGALPGGAEWPPGWSAALTQLQGSPAGRPVISAMARRF